MADRVLNFTLKNGTGFYMTEIAECDQNIIKSKLFSFFPLFFFPPEVSAVQSMVVVFFFLFFRTGKSLTISTNSNSAQGREKLLEHMGVRTEVFSS